MESVNTRIKSAYASLKDEFGYKNVMQAPKVEKVVISVGTGRVQDKAKLALIRDRLALITGQKAAPRPAKQSVASFKSRKGDIIGYQITLRGARMVHFLDKLVHLALPQTRDFQGLKRSSIDAMGNYSIGIKEHTIFPECGEEEIKDVFPLGITIVTTAKGKKEAEAFLRHIGVPLQAA
ncbi:50S ribosomal protein L5 [Patescibacteria group bacterium]|nr:50S ribosomal protein L5 [Patescibacteria group bacterium]